MKAKNIIKNFSGTMQQFWALVSKFLKVTFREKENWFWIFGYPLLFMLIYSVAFNDAAARSTYTIVIINNDTIGLDNPETDMGANVSQYIMQLFEENSSLSQSLHKQDILENGTVITEKLALELLSEEKIDGVIIIPENFSETIIGSTWWYPLLKQGIIPGEMGSEFTQFMLALNETDYSSGTPSLQIHTIADTVTGVVITNIFEGIVNNIVLSFNNITTLDIEQHIGPDNRDLTWFDMSAPGLVAMAVLVGISTVATLFAFERSTGILRRLDTTPVSRSTILLSGGAAQIIFSAIQITILFGCLPLFGVNTSPDANWILAFTIISIFLFQKQR